MVKYTIIIEKGNRNFSAYCPDCLVLLQQGRLKRRQRS